MSQQKRRQKKSSDDLLHWRRSEVVKLSSQGLTIDKTADILKVSPATIKRDHAFIRQNSQQVLQQYFTDTLPNEVLKAIARLTAVSDESWEMAHQAKKDRNQKLQTEALRLAKDAANDITNIVTNNKSLIESARAVEGNERQLTELERMEQEEHELLSKDGAIKESVNDPEAIF